jgi:drug/metabolite transporter (DMT)-like permease
MDQAGHALLAANLLYARTNTTNGTDTTSAETATRPPIYKAIGISLAVASGCFIGVSFVLKKMGLLKANEKYDEVAGEGYGYLKNAFWWTGMTLMIVGEICNFVAYAFVDAILVTPLGALSVVITTILSAIFLKERLSMVGKVGCFLCIIGSVVIVMNAPSESSAANIQEMQHFVIAPGFLSYAGVVIVACVFIALWAGPRYGKKSMLVYLTICSLIGGLSVVATQGLGAAIVAQIGGTPQFNQWFLYVLLVFVITTLVTEIIYLNVSSTVSRMRLSTNSSSESTESFQCCPGNTNVLRLLHEFNHYYLCNFVPGIQGISYIHYHCCYGILRHLCWGSSSSTFKICQRCARYSCICR